MKLPQLNPSALARYEKDNYVAYYRKEWLKLLRVSIGLVKESFGLNWLQAAYGAYLIARAEIAFAPFPENDLPRATAYITRFYTSIKRIRHGSFDPAHVARLELNWWIVHRKCFGNADNAELVEAVTALYAEAYGVDPAKVREAARLPRRRHALLRPVGERRKTGRQPAARPGRGGPAPILYRAEVRPLLGPRSESFLFDLLR